jgi:hypothetical protein
LDQGFITDPTILRCPFPYRIGRYDEWRAGLRDETFLDRQSISYSYEFISEELTELRNLDLGVEPTFREYKQRQQEKLGDTEDAIVPIVRCLAHRPVLNLTLSGRIYESAIHWEDNPEVSVDHHELAPPEIFRPELEESVRLLSSATTERRALQVPPRDPMTPEECLDLTRHYTAQLTESWHQGHEGNDLRALGQGLRQLDGIHWDLRGLIQLRSVMVNDAAFPWAVTRIPVNRTCQRIHLLQGTGWSSPMSSVIGAYIVHYADGLRAEIPIRYGLDVEDWWYDPKSEASSQARVAWSGENQATRKEGKAVRLYRSTWENPRPESVVKSIDIESKVKASAPFVVAITLE